MKRGMTLDEKKKYAGSFLLGGLFDRLTKQELATIVWYLASRFSDNPVQEIEKECKILVENQIIKSKKH